MSNLKHKAIKEEVDEIHEDCGVKVDAADFVKEAVMLLLGC